MKIINLNKLIQEYNNHYGFIDKAGIEKLKEDVYYKFCESGANEGDYFCLEEIKYFKNGFSSLDKIKITLLFNFKVISKKYKYIIDEDTGEQVFDEVIEEIVEYLGFE